MNTKIASFILTLVLAAMACTLPLRQDPAVPHETATTGIVPTSLPTFTPTAEPSSMPLNTPEDTGRAYYDAWLQADADRLASLISEFSLEHSGVTRDSVRAEFKKKIFNGLIVEDYEVLESRMLDDTTALVRIVTHQRQGAGDLSTHDQQVAFRQENGEWRLNWNSIVDVIQLRTPAQTINGLEIQPVELQRYTDHLKITLNAHNTSGQAVQWGWTNDVTVTAFFPDKSANDLRFRFAFEPDRSYPDLFGKFEGFFEAYPDKLRLSNFMSTNQQGLPVPGGTPWSYEFSLVPTAP